MIYIYIRFLHSATCWLLMLQPPILLSLSSVGVSLVLPPDMFSRYEVVGKRGGSMIVKMVICDCQMTPLRRPTWSSYGIPRSCRGNRRWEKTACVTWFLLQRSIFTPHTVTFPACRFFFFLRVIHIPFTQRSSPRVSESSHRHMYSSTSWVGSFQVAGESWRFFVELEIVTILWYWNSTKWGLHQETKIIL